MKRLTMEQWEDKYIKGEVRRFDQKNQMFIRPGWDPEINGMIEDWSLNGPPKDKPDTLFHRFVRWCTDHARLGDPLYVWGDKMLGYGRAKSADRFWKDWKPGGNR